VVHREGPYVALLPERVEVHGEEHVGRLGLPVRLPLVISPLEPHVVPADAGPAVPGGGDRDDPRSVAGARDRGPEPVDERVVTEVVGGELRLPAGPDPRLRAGHDPGVVDDDVGAAAGGEEPFGEAAHALQVTEVEFVDLDAVEAGERLFGGLRPSRGDDDVRSGPYERPRGLQPEAGVTAGHDREPVRKVDPPQDVVRGALRVEA
jgi:hypothetical protein